LILRAVKIALRQRSMYRTWRAKGSVYLAENAVDAPAYNRRKGVDNCEQNQGKRAAKLDAIYSSLARLIHAYPLAR